MNSSTYNIKENFMHNIKWLREKHLLSKDVMANILEIDENVLTRIENGEVPSNLDINIFSKIEEHFAIDFDKMINHYLEE